ncbi:MAG: 5-formyltetrahydrofolate cyclo-ligase [Oscillospiraceae bacterium]|nr:5-formyltetrahydrofolate cyclo-ligase [Oscillospiraceae bacterium]
MDLVSEKRELRRLALSRRDALESEARAAASLALCRALASLPELKSASRVLAFVPVGSECDLRAFYGLLRGRGAALAFPVTAQDGKMEAYIPDAPLVPGLYSIPEPDPKTSLLLPPEELDAVLVPCVGFDAQGNRLGHGAGYYDRYLRRCPQAAAILTAFEAQRLEHVPCEEHDLSFSLLVTEKGVFRRVHDHPFSGGWQK